MPVMLMEQGSGFRRRGFGVGVSASKNWGFGVWTRAQRSIYADDAEEGSLIPRPEAPKPEPRTPNTDAKGLRVKDLRFEYRKD